MADKNSYEAQKETLKNYRVRLKERMLYVMGGKCQICGYDKCPQALEFHHINPEEKEFTIAYNQNKSWETNAKELRKCTLLCANCHRELHAGLIDESDLISPFNEEKAKEISEKIKDLKHHKIYYCKNCGKEIGARTKNQLCSECYALASRKVERPDRQTLKDDIRNMSMLQVGKKYGVSDNAIRKWCDAYGLPRKKTEINSYSDEEWEKF